MLGSVPPPNLQVTGKDARSTRVSQEFNKKVYTDTFNLDIFEHLRHSQYLVQHHQQSQ